MDDRDELKNPILQRYLKYYEGLKYDEEIIRCPEGSEMRSDWSTLPLLALKQVLMYLNRTDALSCMSTCRHWRSAMLMYEDKKTTLKLIVNDIERSLFVLRIFRRQTKRLIIVVNTTDKEQMATFVKTVVPLIYEIKLQELVFVGNSYLQQNPLAAVPEVPRTMMDDLVLNMGSVKKLAIMGCKISSGKNRELSSKNKNNIRGKETYRIREFSSDPSPCDSILSRCNTDMMMCSTLQAMVLDYDLISTESLETLSQLTKFRHLTMVIRDKPHFSLHRINWLRLQACYATPLNVTVCLLQLPAKKIEEVMDNVFVQGLKLVSLKALYCKTMHMEAIIQVVNMYSQSLQEFVWTDCPCDTSDNVNRSLKSVRMPELNNCDVNPLILMCWQCERLKRVVVHGYWIWQYDVVGMVRLRRGLQHLELSSVFPPLRVNSHFLEQINSLSEMSRWRPVPAGMLHPGLRAAAPRRHRADYILLETTAPPGVTYPHNYWRPRYYEELVPSKTQV